MNQDDEVNIPYNVGVAKSETPITGFTDSRYHSSETIHRVAIITGLSGVRLNESFFSNATRNIDKISTNIGFIASDTKLNNIGNPVYVFPPAPKSFHELENPEELYIWRWITLDAPDLVIELVETTKNETCVQSIGLPEADKFQFIDSSCEEDNSLLAALASGLGPTPGSIPGIRITTQNDNANEILKQIIEKISRTKPTPSEASLQLQNQNRRNAKEVSNKLAQVYGFKLDQPINYVQGVAISGRLRLRAIDNDYPDPVGDITTLVDFLTKDEEFDKNNNSGPNLAAMCWTEELYESSNDTKWKELLIKAANTYEKVPKGISPKPCHPDFGCEDMFFISAILGRAFKVTDDISYVNAFVDFLLEAEVQQDDGLFWHSRTPPYVWGRGNGFSALAYSEALTYMPNNYPRRKQILDIHTRHLAGMINNQLPNGTWSQLIDLPGTYQELSVTCMVGYALARGIRKGWLDNSFMPALEKTWSAAKKRISDNGDLVDVCSGTGFQQKRSDYIYRKAEYGYDDRGGSMAIWFSTEMALLEGNN